MADGTGQSRLTGKRAIFVDAYLGSAQFNATEAARIAGYAVPMQEGYRLLRNADVAEAIRETLSQVHLDEHFVLALVRQDALRSDADILKVAIDAANSAGVPAGASAVSALISARTTARTNLMKVHGMLTDKQQVDINIREHYRAVPQSMMDAMFQPSERLDA